MAPFDPDPQQRAVLDHPSGPMLVSGGFGTGKTTILRERFARLIDDGADPERLALVVGSRRARDEARRVVLQRLPLALPSLTIVTMQGLAYHVVGQRFDRLAYPAPPTVLSASEQFTRVRELLLGEDSARWPAYGPLLQLRGFADEVRQFVIRAQESLVSPEDIERRAAERDSVGWRELASFLRQYLEVLDSNGEVDFAGLVEQAAVAAAHGEPLFDHVIVDDHQDTTLAAERLLHELRATSLVVAGNLEAHVFSFQGTTDEPLRRFAERNSGAVEVTLTNAHRSAAGLRRGVARRPRLRAAHRRRARAPQDPRRGGDPVERPGRHLASPGRARRRTAPRARRRARPARDDGVRLARHPAGHPSVHPRAAVDRRRSERTRRPDRAAPDVGDRAPVARVGANAVARSCGPTAVRSARRSRCTRSPRPASEKRSTGSRTCSVARTTSEPRCSTRSACSGIGLPFSADLVRRAETDHHARVDLDAIVALASAIEAAGAAADPSVEAFLLSLGAAEGAPELSAGAEGGPDAVHVLTAHAAAGRGFDTVIVLDALEGDFPSLSRPEPMFDLTTLEGVRARSEINRRRLADERRLFQMVCRRAGRRVVLTATHPSGGSGVTLASRFVEEMDVGWLDVPAMPFADPVSVSEAAATWRRLLSDPGASAPERIASLDGLLALGDDPRRWWFQRDWTDLSAEPKDELSLSYSRLSTLENCDLQFVLSSELGLDPAGGYQAWLGKEVHAILEACDKGEIERTPEAFERALDERWDASRFPSYAISEAERANAKAVVIPNWFSRYAEPPATAIEQAFTFEFEGARIRGKIDRIGPVPEGGTRITDYKTGRSDNAPKAADSLQLGIYYLAVGECEELAEHRPVEAVELAFLGGKRGDRALDVKEWAVSEDTEEDYKHRMRDRIATLISRIRELDRGRTYVADTQANCFFCRFQTLCTRYPQGGPVFPLEEPGPVIEAAP